MPQVALKFDQILVLPCLKFEFLKKAVKTCPFDKFSAFC
jgi:hypothetical protein